MRITIINPQFEANRERVDEGNSVTVWGPADPLEKHGTRGTYVAVDFDTCLADEVRLEDYPVDVFTWVDTPGHPESGIKAEPTHKNQCTDYILCVNVCPVDAIDIDPRRAGYI